MNQTEHIELMHAVLDGEATPEQEQALNGLLAKDPVVRGHFEELRRLFTILGRVSAALPPENLVDSVTAEVRMRLAQRDPRHQPFERSGVLATESVEARDPVPGISAGVHRVSRPVQFLGGMRMSEQKSGFVRSTKGKVLIGAGVAAAAVLAVTTQMDFQSSGTESVGTIVPAQRYRAQQNTADDIKVGSPSGTQSAQTGRPFTCAISSWLPQITQTSRCF